VPLPEVLPPVGGGVGVGDGDGGGVGVGLPGSVDHPGSFVHQGVVPDHHGIPGSVAAAAADGQATIAPTSTASAILGARARRVLF
jgi:hypothetical protein